MNFNLMEFRLLTARIVQKKLPGIFFLSALLALTACGGGGTSSTSTNNDLPSPVAGGIDGEDLVPGPDGKDPAPPSELELLPVVSVGPRQFADPNVLLTLRGTVAAAEGAEIVKTLWTQVSGPEVRIPSPLRLTNLILVPDVNIATQVEFRLTAEDSEGRVNSATVSVLIKPVPTFVKVIGGVFNEADGDAFFTVSLNAPNDLPVLVSYVTQDGSAGESDYVFTSGELEFAPGEVSKEVQVSLINDVGMEDDESFSLRVTAINGEATYANVGVVIIRNGVEPQLEQAIQFGNQGSVTIYLNESFLNLLDPEVVPPGTGAVVYVSSNPAVATVDANGVATALSVGSATITVIKYADDIYFSAEDSYNLQVIGRGTPPAVTIVEPRDGYSIPIGQTLYLVGEAYDEEDGWLPGEGAIGEGDIVDATTVNALGSFAPTYQWTSDLEDEVLSTDSYLETNSLEQGVHTITYSVSDSDNNIGSASVRVIIGNIAPYAVEVYASSTFCIDGGSCYSPNRINDMSLSTALGDQESWSNDDLGLPQWVALYWPSQATINAVDLYTSETYPLRDYDIEYLNEDSSWISVVSVDGNTSLYRSHTFPEIKTNELRVLVRSGPTIQPNYGRVNELVVFGTTSGLLTEGFVESPRVEAE